MLFPRDGGGAELPLNLGRGVCPQTLPRNCFGLRTNWSKLELQTPDFEFEIFDSGIFWVGKFGKYFFGWLDLSKDFFGIKNNLKIHGSALAA